MEAITNEDLQILQQKVPHIAPEIKDPDSIRSLLIFFGIRNRQQLAKFAEAKDVFDYLADIYERELKRSNENPLDWTAVAIWGAILFTRGLREDIKAEIEKKIRESDEYRQKHPIPEPLHS